MNETTDSSKTEVPPWAAGAELRMHELDPVLNEGELAQLGAYGEIRQVEKGDVLWRAGERADFFAVVTGQLDIYHADENGEDVVFISHGPGHYAGEIITMSAGRALVSGRAYSDSKVVVLSPEALRRVITNEADLGEKLFQSFILRRMRLISENLSNVRLLGRPENAQTAYLQRFLSRSGVPFSMLNPDSDSQTVDRILSEHKIIGDQLPVLISHGESQVQPTIRQVAEQLGFTAEFDCGVTYDLAVIGSGPAGIASAVYAASEGLSVLVLESFAMGGQAGSSSKIENYMGFPTGISGQALMGRGYLQAQKFGAAVAIARELQGFECGDHLHKLSVDGNDIVYARSVVIASGAIYRQPTIPRLDELGGVHYGASHIEGQLCRGKDIAIIGGGNSAGQAAVYLSSRAASVHILVRGPGLAASMSDYLVQRIDSIPNVHLHTHTEIQEVLGDESVEAIRLNHNDRDEQSTLNVAHLFIFIGAVPGTGFVDDQFALDDKGFILTGDGVSDDQLKQHGWKLARRPSIYETSCPRVFAVGDVRAGSVKRVASAVGEGSVAVQFVHEALSELDSPSS